MIVQSSLLKIGRFATQIAARRHGGDYVVVGGGGKGKGCFERSPKSLDLQGVEPKPHPDPKKLKRELVQRIRFSGPISVHQYMQEVLSNPLTGYYMGKDVFGAKGDFVTSPEISQMFGECLALFIANEWMKTGSRTPMHLVELGPGRGTLMSDMLRVLKRLLPEKVSGISVHLVETSPKMRELQEAKLCQPKYKLTNPGFCPIFWHHRVDQVPKGFSFFVAHEFFDALPIRKFVRVPTENGPEWREVLIGVDDNDELRFVRAKDETPAVKLVGDNFLKDYEAIEVNPRAATLVKIISERIGECGGGALIADYGNDRPAKDSFRAFKNHQLHDVLKDPGTADLTADVDFSYLKRHINDRTMAYGPVPQGDFLHSMGIAIRLEQLYKHSSSEEKKQLESAYKMLVSPDQMGQRFKFMSIFPKNMEQIYAKFPPAGFSSNPV